MVTIFSLEYRGSGVAEPEAERHCFLVSRWPTVRRRFCPFGGHEQDEFGELTLHQGTKNKTPIRVAAPSAIDWISDMTVRSRHLFQGLKARLLLLCMPFVAVGAVKLPKPDGPYAVSRRTFIWTDGTRLEDTSIPDRSVRHLAVFVFYPAATTSKPAVYYPGLANLDDSGPVAGLKAQFLGSWNDVRDGKVETSISENGLIADSTKPFPVLLFSPGLSVPALAYSIQLTELASHGYVIFALDHPYDTALVQLPDGKSIAFADRHAPKGPPNAAFFRVDAERESVWTKDTQFALVQIQRLNSEGQVFKKRLDVSKLVSLGIRWAAGSRCKHVRSSRRSALV